MKQGKFKKSILLISGLMFAACSNPAPETEKAEASTEKQIVFDRLVGTWKGEDGTFERWKRNPDNSYTSIVFKLNVTDTVINENVHIYQEKDQWIFDTKVTGQNEGKSVKFTASSLQENSVQFSNPEHDFPNDINYTLANDKTVNAFIVGRNDKGGFDTIPFHYTRVN